MSPAVAPHDIDAETALLGAMLATRDAVRAAIDAGVTADDYYDHRHGPIHTAILSLFHRGITIDLVTVDAELNGHGAKVGGKPTLQKLFAAGGIAPQQYAKIIHGHAQARRLAHLLDDARTQVLQGDNPTALLEQIRITPGGTSGLRIADLAAVCTGTIDEEHPEILTRLDNQALLYLARINYLYGEPSVGKTWIAYAAGADTLGSGGSVLTVDWEDTDKNFVTRMRTIGVDDQVLTDPARVRWVHPELGLRNDIDRAQLLELVEHLIPPVLVIVDAYGPALARDGIEENSNSDVLQWTDRALAPLARAGASVLILDHVSKDPATRTRGGRGAGAKLGLVTGAAYDVRTIQAFSRGRPGRLKLIIGKDRLGHVGPVGATAGEVVITPDHDQVHISIEPPLSGEGDGPFRPTHLMEKVSRYVESADEPVTARTIERDVPGKGNALRGAIRLLAEEGFITESGKTRRGGGSLYVSERPFRETDPTASQPRPNRVPDADPLNRVPRPPPNEVRGTRDAVQDLAAPLHSATSSLDYDPWFDPTEEPPEDDTGEPHR